MPKLTKRFLETIQPDPVKTLKYWDTELKGFGIVILPSGRCTYCIQYRNADRVQKRIKIGVHGHITAEEARNLAKIHLGKVAHGEDLAEETKQARNRPTFNDLAKDYIERHGPKKRASSLKQDQMLLEKTILPVFGPMKVESIDRRSIEALHVQLANTPYKANHVLALLSKMFSLAESWGWRVGNPVRGIEKYQEEKRERWLNEEEIERLWTVLDQHPQHLTAYIFKFLLLTGARKGEAMQATWDQFDLEKGTWTKPSHLTKQKKTEHLPLSDQALGILQEIKKLSGNSVYLFPGRVEGQPIKEIKTFWRSAIKAAKLTKVRIHDLRHTHASHLVSDGLSLTIVGKLLGHTQTSTTQRYAHLADKPLRQATELFSAKVKGVAIKKSALIQSSTTGRYPDLADEPLRRIMELFDAKIRGKVANTNINTLAS